MTMALLLLLLLLLPPPLEGLLAPIHEWGLKGGQWGAAAAGRSWPGDQSPGGCVVLRSGRGA